MTGLMLLELTAEGPSTLVGLGIDDVRALTALAGLLPSEPL